MAADCTPGSPNTSIEPCNLLCNTNFECPDLATDFGIGDGTSTFVPKCIVPCWDTLNTESPTGNPECPIGKIEIWRGTVGVIGSGGGPPGPGPYSGKQFIELNASQQAKFFQNFTVSPGTVVTISFAHAGRIGYPNIMHMALGAAGGWGAPILDPTPVTFPDISGTLPSLTAIGSVTGSGYTTGTYFNVPVVNEPLAPPTGVGVLATVTVAGGIITSVVITNFGTTPYLPGNKFTFNNVNIGGTGSGFVGVFIANQWTVHTYSHTFTGVATSYAIIFDSTTGVAGGNFLDDINIFLTPPSVIASNDGPVTGCEEFSVSASIVPGALSYSWSGPFGYTSNLRNPPPINNLVPGIYTFTVTVIDANNCSSTSETFVTVNPCTINVIAASNSTCLASSTILIGDTLQLLASTVVTAISYAWSGPNGWSSGSQNPIILSASVLNAGTYTVTVTDDNCCTTTDTVEVCIRANPCFLITDCVAEIDGGQVPFLTSTDLSAYVDKTINFCIGGIPPLKVLDPGGKCFELTNCCTAEVIIINAPPTGNILNGYASLPARPGECWSFERITCPDPLPGNYLFINWAPQAGPPPQLYDSCQECVFALGLPCNVPVAFFQFTNCCNSNDTLIIGSTYTAFSSNLGLVVEIPSIPELLDKCWKVDPVPQGTNTSLSTITINNTNPVITHVDCDEAPCPDKCITKWPDNCYCATVTEVPNCTGSEPWTGEIVEVFDTCALCDPKCYILTDCAGIEPSVVASNNFAAYVGQVVILENCGDHCWLVEEAPSCDDSSCVPPVIASFATCVLCLPPVIPVPPMELHPRRVKPGYYTPGCPPEYTERIYCTFAEAVFDEMAKVRYGISVCCDEDVDKWDIKKQELDLRALYDPELCKSTLACCAPCVVSCIAPTNATAIIS